MADDTLRATAAVLARIADAYDANGLDEARPKWIERGITFNPPENTVLFTGRGGKTLLTLGDCFRAREALRASVVVSDQTSPNQQDVAALVADLNAAADMRDELKERYWHRASALKRRAATALLASEARATALEAERDRVRLLVDYERGERTKDAAEYVALEAQLAQAREALEPFANCIFNDNGDITVSPRHFSSDELIAAYFARKALRSPAPADGRGDDELDAQLIAQSDADLASEEMLSATPPADATPTPDLPSEARADGVRRVEGWNNAIEAAASQSEQFGPPGPRDHHIAWTIAKAIRFLALTAPHKERATEVWADQSDWKYLAEEWERQFNSADARAREWEARHDVVEAALAIGALHFKPLVWEPYWGGGNEDIPSWRGKNPLGLSVDIDFAGTYSLEEHSDAPADELEARKVAKQAEYEARIRSAFTVPSSTAQTGDA